MPSISADDQTQLHYRVVGSGPQTVILVHGWMVSGAVYDGLLDVLGHEGLRVVIPDLRGSGASAPSSSGYSIEQYAKDVLAVADAVGATRFALVGHSMGGQISQFIAATAPHRVTGMALLCPVPASGAPLPEDAAALFRSSGGDAAKQGTILDLACKLLEAGDKAKLLQAAAAISPECIQGSFEAWSRGGFAERLSAITAPTLVVGTDDPFLPPAFLRAAIVEAIADARYVHLPGPGHYPLVERPNETAAVVGAFLAGLGR